MDAFINPVSIRPLKIFPALVHGFSPRYFYTRDGEKTELLLGKHADDNSSARHRQWFLRSLSIDKTDQVFILNQTHSDRVYVLDDVEKTESDIADEEADAIVTHLTDRPLGVLTADCLPIIIYDPVLHVTGVTHAGRKGTQARILSKTLDRMRDVYGCQSKNIKLGMGPGIGGCCYEVDGPCIEPFRLAYPLWKRFVKNSAPGKFKLDLLSANEQDANDAGILSENIFRSGDCTACANHLWYSYRREGVTGRILTLSMLAARPGPGKG